MSPLPAPTESALRRALIRAERGVTLDATEAETLLHARGLGDGEPLDRLLTAAGRVRDAGLASAGRPGVVTYSRKVFIPLTHLCRDRCHYCTFVTTPGQLRAQGKAPFLSPDEVLDIARAGAAMGCKEALFTLGDRPEDRWPVAAEWLHAHGFDSTLGYLRAMAIRVLEETGLLPHLNPGVLTWEEIQRLKPVSASMGMMLETTATRLWSEPGGPHFGSPDKEPAVRLRVLEDAGRSAVPFTTGVLLGIGEDYAERVDAIREIRASAQRHGHVQEVIVQNFRAKPRTAMQAHDDLELQEYVAAVAVTRLLLGPKARVQAPPNLSDSTELGLLLRAGVDDWGGVSPADARPRQPRAAVAEHRQARRAVRRGRLRAARAAGRPAAVRAAARAVAGPAGAPARRRAGRPGRARRRGPHARSGCRGRSRTSPGASSGRVDLHVEVDTVGRTTDRRSDFDAVYGDWSELRERTTSARDGHSTALAAGDREVLAALLHAEQDPAGLSDAEYLALLGADGTDLDALSALADAVRADVNGDDVTYVVNRNINFTNVCYTGCRFCAFAQRRTDADAYTLSMAQVGDRVDEAWAAGATEICMQGGIHPDLPGTAYFDLAREVKKRQPGIHLHAFSPMEIVNGAARTGLSFPDFLTAAKEAGLDSIPGTAAEILDDDVRWVLTKGKLPTATWLEIITTAHRVGIPTTSTMMYGHVDTPAHWVAHLRTLAAVQDETGGFTEFVLLPFVHHNSPIYLAGVARPGPTVRENRAVHAVARLLLHGRIPNIQTSWVKLADAGTKAVLQGGANDLGGTLMEETISRMAGSENGSLKTIAELEAMAAAIGRPARQRTTEYGTPSAERLATARSDEGRRRLTLSITPT